MSHPADENVETKEMDSRSLSSNGQEPYVHKVGIPPKQSFFKEFLYTVKETFFSDDPLRPFKDQTKSRKFVLGIEAIFPILSWGRTYNLQKFRGDLIAGLTIASLCIPQVNLLQNVDFDLSDNCEIVMDYLPCAPFLNVLIFGLKTGHWILKAC